MPTDTPPPNSTVQRFTGAWDEQTDSTSGLILMGERPYDPNLGRFLAVDPVDGGSLNNYDYAGQDPVNAYDLDGLLISASEDYMPSGRVIDREITGCFTYDVLSVCKQLESDYGLGGAHGNKLKKLAERTVKGAVSGAVKGAVGGCVAGAILGEPETPLVAGGLCIVVGTAGAVAGGVEGGVEGALDSEPGPDKHKHGKSHRKSRH